MRSPGTSSRAGTDAQTPPRLTRAARASARSQIAAIFGTAVLTIQAATHFSGMLDPVSSLQGTGALIGQVYPTTHFLTISRGTFSKALGFADLYGSFIPLLIAIPVLLGLTVALLKKQET